MGPIRAGMRLTETVNDGYVVTTVIRFSDREHAALAAISRYYLLQYLQRGVGPYQRYVTAVNAGTEPALRAALAYLRDLPALIESGIAAITRWLEEPWPLPSGDPYYRDTKHAQWRREIEQHRETLRAVGRAEAIISNALGRLGVPADAILAIAPADLGPAARIIRRLDRAERYY